MRQYVTLMLTNVHTRGGFKGDLNVYYETELSSTEYKSSLIGKDLQTLHIYKIGANTIEEHIMGLHFQSGPMDTFRVIKV